jgi:hypothetical protein
VQDELEMQTQYDRFSLSFNKGRQTFPRVKGPAGTVAFAWKIIEGDLGHFEMSLAMLARCTGLNGKC